MLFFLLAPLAAPFGFTPGGFLFAAGTINVAAVVGVAVFAVRRRGRLFATCAPAAHRARSGGNPFFQPAAAAYLVPPREVLEDVSFRVRAGPAPPAEQGYGAPDRGGSDGQAGRAVGRRQPAERAVPDLHEGQRR